jgi:predicted AAA+ superfamily ATPase
MVPRDRLIRRIREALDRSRVVALLGPRQCGKTTLAREIVPLEAPEYFDLENPRDLQRLQEPMSALEGLRRIVVIDEVQRCPELFPILRVLADRTPLPAQFVLLGSASPAMLRQSSESLAGRMERILMGGFSLDETGIETQAHHWLRGGFPRSFLAKDEEASYHWRREFIQTFLERDIPQLGLSVPAFTMHRFWSMVAHYHGQVWNAAEPARSLGISETMVRRYLDLLSDLYMVRQLPAWHANLRKRQVKSPKMYFRDTGLLHQLLGIADSADLLRHPKCGASWEGYVIEETVKAIEPDQAYFWATHQGAELDLLLVVRGKLYGVECKRADAPGFTRSMRIALDDLQLERLAVVYPGPRRYQIADRVEVVPLPEVINGMDGLFLA